MAKRRQDFDVLDVRRKSARLLAIGPAKDDALKPQMISEDLCRGIGPSGAIAYCETYNQFRLFAQDRTADGRIKARANAVAKAVLAVEASLRKAEQDLTAKTLELERRVSAFAEASMDHAGGYAGNNLLNLETDDFYFALDHIHISDPQHFLTYVRMSVQDAFKAEELDDEYSLCTSSQTNGTKFSLFDKMMALMGLMLNHNGSHACFHLMLLAKTLCHRRSPRVRSIGPTDLHNELDEVIHALVDAPEDNRMDCDIKEYPDDHSKHECEIEAGGLCWRDLPLSEKGIEYWNFASAARTLLSSYQDKGHGCSLDGETSRAIGYRDDSEKCLHINSAKMLDWLQKKAWGEIRSNVMRVVGHRLPVELADSIFEFALESECIPAMPGVYEKFRPENSHSNKNRGLRYRMESRLRNEYVCPRTRPNEYSNKLKRVSKVSNTEPDPGDE
ncbi:hypothetical protein LTR17_002095 [Elasticomyces elasticus]|nr:hypothetical protein LTR17_002095 [Elasticomyces elasticus]